MDTLLQQPHHNGDGLTIHGLTICSAAHADGIRYVSNSLKGLRGQTATIENFARDNAISRSRRSLWNFQYKLAYLKTSS